MIVVPPAPKINEERPSRKATLLGDPNCRPKALPVNEGGIPPELKVLRQFVGWNFEWRKKKEDQKGLSPGKWTKPPRQALNGKFAKVNAPNTWCAFADAFGAYEDGRVDGIGVVLKGGTGVDLDDCVAEDGTIADWALTIIAQLDTYAEFSPTGTGIKLYCYGTLPPDGRRKGNVEMYDDSSARYFTLTGHKLPNCPSVLNERTAQLAAIHAKYIATKPEVEADGKVGSIQLTTPSAADLDDNAIIDKALASKNGNAFRKLWEGSIAENNGDPSRADLALCGSLAFWVGPDVKRIDRLFRQSGLMRDKWDERRGKLTYGEKTIAKALKGRSEYYKPGFNSNDYGDSVPGSHPRKETREPIPKTDSEFPSAVIASALKVDAGPLSWLWYGFIADKGITLFSALWKIGKTTLLAHLVRNMGNGVALCGYEVTPATVLYITEEGEKRWAKRRDALGIGDNVYFIWRPFKGKPSAPKWLAFIAHVKAEAERIEADLIVFDTLSALWPVQNENDAGEVQAALMPLWTLADGSALLLVHHLKKGDGAEATGSRGSGALPGFVDTIMELRRHEASDRQSRKRVIAGYGRDEETPAEIIVELDAETNEYRGLGDRKGAKREEIKRTLLTLLPTERPGLTVEEIKEAWPNDEFPRKGTMLEALTDGANCGDWIRDGTGKKGNPYRFFVPGKTH